MGVPEHKEPELSVNLSTGNLSCQLVWSLKEPELSINQSITKKNAPKPRYKIENKGAAPFLPLLDWPTLSLESVLSFTTFLLY